jgi:hypothetical protein
MPIAAKRAAKKRAAPARKAAKRQPPKLQRQPVETWSEQADPLKVGDLAQITVTADGAQENLWLEVIAINPRGRGGYRGVIASEPKITHAKVGQRYDFDAENMRSFQRMDPSRRLENLGSWEVEVTHSDGHKDAYGAFSDLGVAQAAAQKHASKPGVVKVVIDGAGKRLQKRPF